MKWINFKWRGSFSVGDMGGVGSGGIEELKWIRVMAMKPKRAHANMPVLFY
jgi:hypothetical protein